MSWWRGEIMTAILVAIGSVLGGVSGYGVSLWLNGGAAVAGRHALPWGTFSVNVLGPVAAGLAAVWIGYLISK